jgi:hypothetical protein
MARKQPQRPAETWTLYRNDPSSADHPDAFEAADKLDYPTLAWWRKANPPPKLKKDKRKRPQPPTDAAYWRNRSPSRLLRSDPLPGESKAAARKRVALARSYFARLANYLFRTKHARKNQRGAEWRIVLRGYVAGVAGPGRGMAKITDGRQASPWEKIAAGEHVSDADIRARYLETSRRAVAIVAKHAPAWADTLGTFTPARGYLKSDAGVVFPDGDKRNDGVVLEVRR